VKEQVGCLALFVSVPLCLDSLDLHVLNARLSAVPGKDLINSVSGEDLRLREVLSLVYGYQAAIIGLF
jgi:5-methyltetrahydrofolate--homocysteine methyltransferase